MKYPSVNLAAVRALFSNRRAVRIVLLAVGIIIFILTLAERHTSWFQAHLFSLFGKNLTYRVKPGLSPLIVQSPQGPYDQRLGYALLPKFTDELSQNGFAVTSQTRPSLVMRLVSGYLYAPFREKTQAGLALLDQKGRPLYRATYPKYVYNRFEAIPESIVKTLLFIENRELLDARFPYRNPAVEWARLAKATFAYGVAKIGRDKKPPGGSTLATQIEKYRHSPAGRTDSASEKLKQMASASQRAYLDGTQTFETRKRIVLDYVNSIPLGGIPGYGEIMGIGDGLWAWYNTSIESVSTALNTYAQDRPPVVTTDAPLNKQNQKISDKNITAWAVAYKQVLSLLLAQRRPWFYLVEHPDSLELRTQGYLRVLADAGLLTPQERDAALKTKLQVQRRKAPEAEMSFTSWKTANAVRPRLLTLLDVPQFYDLDRLDLSVYTSFDQAVQDGVTQTLLDLQNPVVAEKAGLREFRLLEYGDPSKVIYSLTLYERGKDANLLRVQTDNYDKPLNINEGIKLEMGSSAKLRTFITYLEIIADLHGKMVGLSPDSLQTISGADRLTMWAARYMMMASDTTLSAMLDASLNRVYSASPKEKFFTGGGQHTFSNFDSRDDNQVFKLREALYHSVNLVFVRLMRDVVNYHIYQRSQHFTQIKNDPKDPRRQGYLEQFADQEGRTFQGRFFKKYQNKGSDAVLNTFIDGLIPTPRRLALIFRTVQPQADVTAFSRFMRDNLPESPLTNKTLQTLYDKYGPDAYSLVDRAFLARVHPLELWMVAYLYAHPKAGLSDVVAASVQERKDVYGWLFKTNRKHRQDKRIRIMMELEAFQEIHRSWKRLRYPFESLVPSLATALGSSADRPAALSELMGILIHDGMWYPSIRVEGMRFAAQTPYEMLVKRKVETPERVLSADIATLVKKELTGVVEKGTGQRVKGVFKHADGTIEQVGGKTGTGDNRHEIYGSGGRLIKSWVVNRTATFVFIIGDRFYGTITAYVAGSEASHYRFTSALPVQVLKILAPQLMPLMETTPVPKDIKSVSQGSLPDRLAPL